MKNDAASQLKLIITGCPCSGTAYVAGLLRFHGYRARHESLDYKVEEKRWWMPSGGGRPHIEVSYVMNQWLKRDPLSNVPVIWLLRNPTRVINSWVAKSLKETGKADVVEAMKRCLAFNKRTQLSENFVYAHRIDMDSDVTLLSVVGAHVDKDPELSRHYKPLTDTNAHNKGTLNLHPDTLKRLPGGKEFYACYKRYYPYE